MERYQYSDLTRRVIGCAMEVHNRLGSGFQEMIYQRALSLELNMAGIRHEREVEMTIVYRGQPVGTRRADFLIEGNVMVEIKAIQALDDVHLAQAINYLEAYDLRVGLLINFGAKSLEFKRIINRKHP